MHASTKGKSDKDDDNTEVSLVVLYGTYFGVCLSYEYKLSSLRERKIVFRQKYRISWKLAEMFQNEL